MRAKATSCRFWSGLSGRFESMAFRSKFVGALAGLALVTVSASPAAAQGRYRWHRHHDDGIDAGAVFGILAAVGIVAAVASASNDRDRRVDDPRYDDPRYDNRGYDDRSYDDRAAPDGADYGYDGRSGDAAYAADGADAPGEDAAANACAIAARDQSTRSGGFAEVRSITAVRPFGNGFDVTGTLDQRASYQARDGRLRSFRCIWDNGAVASVNFN